VLSMLSRTKNGLAVTASGEYQQPSEHFYT